MLTGLWNRHAETTPALSSPRLISSNTATPESWTAVILDANILGLEIPVHERISPEPAEAAATFDWRLLGTVTGTRAKALLRRDEDFVIADRGDMLDGWELVEVRARSAVFASGGRREEVQLWDGQGKAVEAGAEFRPPEMQAWAAPGVGTRVSLSRQDVQPLLSDPNALLQMASFKPFTVDGRVSGFQVLSIRPDSLLHKVGLRNGDVLARINGQALTGPTQLLQAYSGMDRSSLVTLDVQRASQMQTFILELN
ncbi:PDZ domain-containing protein [Desulfonatronum sp. SC1]|uniref:PDZ domain-containing protein n=1 Tax=Desulfonatronum sp. SC1 TaxID=2109626 RepID=UPI0011B1E004|nr:PDZ domain-containing protein [Desulfonatronum sp. SC1]